jgi:peptidoglycan/LPS O-acetylase OafA/YrhL
MYRHDIDGLRALAILAVVVYHAYPSLIPGGFVGVDIFFVISGFLISKIIFENLANNSFSLVEFYSRRIKRIFPALIFVLVVLLFVGWFFLLAEEYRQLCKHILGSASFTSNFILLNEAGYFDGTASKKPLLHLWSLAIEEQFYILWPFFCFFLLLIKSNSFFIILGITLASFFLNAYFIRIDSVFTFYSPLTRFWEILCGSLVALIFIENKNFPNKYFKKIKFFFNLLNKKIKLYFYKFNLFDLIAMIGLILIFFALFRLNDRLLFPGYFAVLPVLGTMFIILCNSKSIIIEYFFSNKIAIWFGLISYPLYLWHWPLLSFARIIEGEVPGKFIRLLLILLSIFLAWITFKFIEKPIRSLHSTKKIALLLLLLMLPIITIGYISYKKMGFEFREINVKNKGVSEALGYDWKEGYRFGECFINDTDTSANKFSKSCGELSGAENPSLLIWGDSHAASFYQGFRSYLQPKNFSVFQYTSSGCPPILDFSVTKRKDCVDNNNYIFNEIKRLSPNNLVLGAFWSMYDGTDGFNKFDSYKLIETILRLKELDIENIILVGHLPSYRVNQPDLLRRNSIFFEERLNKRTYNKFRNSVVEYDNKIKDIANLTGVNFVSPLDLLCNDDGCLLTTPGSQINPLSFDYGHLTTNGSNYLVFKMFDSELVELAGEM